MQLQQPSCSCGFLLEGKDPVKLKNIPVIYPDRPGVNRNVYPKNELIKAVEYYKRLIQVDPTYKYALAKHPKDEDEEWLGLIAGVIDDLYFNEETNRLEMDVTLLPTVWGHFIAWALENGYVIGTSIRGSSKEEPSTWELAGEVIPVIIKRDLLLEGVDFVLYPSFITTHASKDNIERNDQQSIPFSKVVESYVNSLDDGINKKQIYEVLIEGKNLEKAKEQKKSGGNAMGVKDIDVKELELQAKQLHLEIQQGNMELKNLELKKTTLDKSINEKTKKLEEIKAQLEKMETEIKNAEDEFRGKSNAISELARLLDRQKKEIDDLKKEKEQLEKELLELEQRKSDLQEYIRVIEKKSEENISVRFGGKVYDKDNPPKIRIVPIADKVSEASWDDVDKDKLRKLVWLTNDEKLAKKVFGLVEGMDNWKQLKYPVYQPVKSKEDDYDVDLVLNRNGLSTAVAFVFGRPGWALSIDEKKQLIKFLVGKYKELQKEGIADIPPGLKSAAERLRVLEKIEINNKDIAPIIEFAFLTGLVDVEVDEKVQEKIEIDIDDEELHILADAILKMITKESNDIVLEQAERNSDILLRILKRPDGTPTSFADKYEITGKEDFDTFIKETISKFKEKASEGLERIEDAVYGFIEGSVDNSEEVKGFLSEIFDFLNKEISDVEGEKQEVPPQGTSPEKSQPNTPTSPVGEQRENIKNNDLNLKNMTPENVTDTREQKNDNKDGGINMELFEKLKDYVESRFENVSIEDENDLVEFIERISNDYTELFNQVQVLELEKVKEQKINELLEMGIEREIIDEEFEGIESVEELENVMKRLIKIVKKVQESRKHDAFERRKSLYIPSNAREDGEYNKDMHELDKLLSNI